MKRFAALVVLGVLALPCWAAGKVRLYNLKTGEMTQLEYNNGVFRGHGPIHGVMPNGIKISGEFVTVGSGAGDPTAQRGSAILTGEGFTLECEYVARPGVWLSSHGTGSCTDSQGTRYRMIF
jgi:hypothetical protein